MVAAGVSVGAGGITEDTTTGVWSTIGATILPPVTAAAEAAPPGALSLVPRERAAAPAKSNDDISVLTSTLLTPRVVVDSVAFLLAGGDD